MKTLALVIGHSEKSQGAVELKSGLTEWTFNKALAMMVKDRLDGINVIQVYRTSYTALPTTVNELNANLVISLHCNAFDTQASGTETLYCGDKTKDKLIAGIFNSHVVGALGLRDRGIKAKRVEDRGGYLLKNVIAPCIIAEPFFIDNAHDVQVVNERISELIVAYTRAIVEICDLL